MTRLFMLGVVAITLAGCAMRTAYLAPPTVDMRGVDQAKYNNDLSDCQDEKVRRTADTFITTNMVSDCMAAKGYKILAGGLSG
jgi:hypothetical protein